MPISCFQKGLESSKLLVTRLDCISWGCLLKIDPWACDFSNMRKDQRTISRRLNVLVEACIVKFERKGRKIVYSIKDDEVRGQLIA